MKKTIKQHSQEYLLDLPILALEKLPRISETKIIETGFFFLSVTNVTTVCPVYLTTALTR